MGERRDEARASLDRPEALERDRPEALEGRQGGGVSASDRQLPTSTTPDVAIVDLGHQRDIELHIEVPPSDLEAVAPQEQWGDIYDRLAG